MTRILIALVTCAVLTAGCSGPKRTSGGGYYKNDGPGSRQVNIHTVPDAVPRIEPHAPANMRPYKVFGREYVPITSERPFRQKGIASWYGRKFHGNKTANGEIYDMYAMTAAHPTLPLPSYARVTHAKSGKSVIVRINDRGPFHSQRIIDLSYVAAAKLDLIGPGSGPVIVEAITHDDIRQNAWHSGTQPKPMPIPAAPPRSTPPTLTAYADVDALSVLENSAVGQSAKTPPANSPASHSVPAASPVHVSARAADTAADAGSSAVFLQYGAFSARENAQRLAHSLNQEISQFEHRRAEVSTAADLHRVQIGPYSSRAQAVNAAVRIQNATGRQATYTIRESHESSASQRRPVSL